MAELNKVLLIGRLTRDPEVKYTPSGTAVAELRLAVNHTYRTKDGEKREETCFIDVSIFGRSVEPVQKYLSKGREIFVEGRLKFDTWEKDGQKRSKHTMVADRFQFLGGRSDRDAAPAEPGGFDAPASNEAAVAEEDDLPF